MRVLARVFTFSSICSLGLACRSLSLHSLHFPPLASRSLGLLELPWRVHAGRIVLSWPVITPLARAAYAMGLTSIALLRGLPHLRYDRGFSQPEPRSLHSAFRFFVG